MKTYVRGTIGLILKPAWRPEQGEPRLPASLAQIIEDIRNACADRVTAWRYIPPRPAAYADFPDWVPAGFRAALAKRGIERLYSHQRQAADLAREGRHLVVVTPTASGKTLCYNLPVLASLLEQPQGRALYVFPTKALSQDQLAEVHGLVESLGAGFGAFTYDGDTPVSARRAIRTAGHIVVTNPDMLHTGILPHHTKWVRLFENLRYVVIDEMHGYRGVFGSHVANVIRRLRRVCRFYGSDPQFILCSATIANPGELAGRLIGSPVAVVNQNGAPAAAKHFALYNPPVVNAQLGIRRSYLLETSALAARLLRQGVPTIVFARSRLNCEVLLSYLQDTGRLLPGEQRRIRGYRGGYLPSERREIERGLRDGSVTGVVATNALELGVDIGQLDAAVMAGYPGSIASAWQQAGRAGRRAGESLAVMIADSSPLNQYLVNHPDYFFGSSPEHGLVNPDNPLISVNHLKCAAFELPFDQGEPFGPSAEETTAGLLYLASQGLVHRSGDRWYWMADAFPAEAISLRSASTDNFVVIDQTNPPKPRVLGELDRFGVPTMLHEEAIYIHEGRQYHVDRLDWQEARAYVRQVNVDHYTDAELAVQLKVLDQFEQRDLGSAGPGRSSVRLAVGLGEVEVRAMATIYKKIRFHTHENIGWGQIHLPEQQMHTAAWWLTFDPVDGSPEGAVDGPVRAQAAADGGGPAAKGSPSDLQGALVGTAAVLHQIAAMRLMCDTGDIGTAVEVRSPHTRLPTIFMYDRYPGGIGLCEKAYELAAPLLAEAYTLISSCACSDGCPSCVGSAAEVGPSGKRAALRLLLGALGRA
jgi:DEAD/DEAH box helicase domain-containing protein